eukprot:7154149-Prorocentrum_lima.AAC.1
MRQPHHTHHQWDQRTRGWLSWPPRLPLPRGVAAPPTRAPPTPPAAPTTAWNSNPVSAVETWQTAMTRLGDTLPDHATP